MRKYFNWLLGKPLSVEIRCLIDAVNNDLVEVVETGYVNANPVLYNGVRVYAYTVNGPSGYTVDLDDRQNCLPRHEAKAVYHALCSHTKRLRKQNALKRDIRNREITKSKLRV
ncbi:hypothetical protein HYP05_gp136 [Salmonella phage ST-W77]|uniref:Uncharacterized protein n=2 Tax=Kuttervirus TaxID=2169536 RepID=A0A678QT05_9CAUD|nr:hypothetical protein FF15_gp049 [Salmonella phage vB-SalM-SJ3]YP_009876081.1 hypothetical protein HYP05_gp136 [Salmonella phage ST-W77]AHV82465.1 hypothetical protein [Salmonella phage vB-SalM-SJ3]ARB12326.1 hypothetical protein STW77_0176 [Salmonella phage ST-W77]EKE9231673.1 hypothetical protein [Salmonella enterica]